MAAQLRLVEPLPPAAAEQSLDASADDPGRITWPEPSDFAGLLECAVDACGSLLWFKKGRATCGRCGVAQMIMR